MLAWIAHWYSQEGMQQLIAGGGVLALALIIFAETGLFVGVILPGDSLLLATGVCCQLNPLAVATGTHAAPPLLPLGWTLAALCVAAIAGNLVNAWFGHLAGDRIRGWPDGRFFKQRHLAEATRFYAQWGGWALVAGRFVPIARTFVPFAAGLARMPARPLVGWSVAGGVLWIVAMVLVGFALAHSPMMVRNLHLLVLAVVALSVLPVAINLYLRWRRAVPETA